MKYLIATSQNANGITEVRVYNSNVITCEINEYGCEVGESLADEKPVAEEDEILIDFTL